MKALTRRRARRREEEAESAVFVQPDVDIVEDKNEYRLIADMPGVGKDGIEVLLEGNELTIVGRRSQEKEEGQYLIRESRPRNYRRTFVLDPEIDTSRIKARIEQGVLTIHLPKADAVKPRRIEISG